ncbi:MAG: DUF2695 domain-containing protein [Pseudonocardiales bacterium]|nr:DUF2695 domain-containing protein [Pseudonocardiales bacterium]
METDAATQAERLVYDLSQTLTAPADRECLPCYLARMLTALTERLRNRGGFCDCEVLLNVYPAWLPDDGQTPAPCQGVLRRGSTKPCRPGRGR